MNTFMKSVLWLLGFACCIACAGESSSGTRSVLEMVSYPDQYVGKRVAMNACYLSGRHGAAIYDCDNKDLLLGVLVRKSVEDSTEGKLLVEKGYGQWPPGTGLVIRVSVEGALVRVDGGGLAFEIMEIRSVTSL